MMKAKQMLQNGKHIMNVEIQEHMYCCSMVLHKNPNKRWEYCKNPVYSNKLGKFILFLVFIFLGVIAYFTIKVLFLHEYPMRFVQK